AEIEGDHVAQLSEKVRDFAASRLLHFEVTHLEPPQQNDCAVDDSGVWITMLGRLESGRAIAQLTGCLRQHDWRVLRGETVGRAKMVGIHLLASKKGISNAELGRIRHALLEQSSGWGVDLAVQRDNVYRQSKRLLCMDVDSTFVKGELIDELAEFVGVKDQ